MSTVQDDFLKSFGKLPKDDSQYLKILQRLIGADGVTIKEEYKDLYSIVLLDFPRDCYDDYANPITIGPLPLRDLILKSVLEIEEVWGKDEDYFSVTDEINDILK